MGGVILLYEILTVLLLSLFDWVYFHLFHLSTFIVEVCSLLCPTHRFYLVILQGLQVSEEACPPVLASILLNSTCLFCCDLRGVNLLVPSFTSAVENVLLDRYRCRKHNKRCEHLY